MGPEVSSVCLNCGVRKTEGATHFWRGEGKCRVIDDVLLTRGEGSDEKAEYAPEAKYECTKCRLPCSFERTDMGAWISLCCRAPVRDRHDRRPTPLPYASGPCMCPECCDKREQTQGVAGPQGRKNDAGKLRYDLIPAGPLRQLAEVYTYGAQKYDDRNWENGIVWGRIFAALMRHVMAFWEGEDNDSEWGLPHLAHAAWCCFALLEYMETHREMDDRPRHE